MLGENAATVSWDEMNEFNLPLRYILQEAGEQLQLSAPFPPPGKSLPSSLGDFPRWDFVSSQGHLVLFALGLDREKEDKEMCGFLPCSLTVCCSSQILTGFFQSQKSAGKLLQAGQSQVLLPGLCMWWFNTQVRPTCCARAEFGCLGQLCEPTAPSSPCTVVSLGCARALGDFGMVHNNHKVSSRKLQ